MKRFLVVSAITWLLWQILPEFGIVFAFCYGIGWCGYRGYLTTKSMTWKCPEPWDFNTWLSKQYIGSNMNKNPAEENLFWHRQYLSRFPKGAKQWSDHKDNPYL